MKALLARCHPAPKEIHPGCWDVTRCYLTLGYYSNLKCMVIYFQSLLYAQGNILGPLAGVNIFMQAIISFKTFADSLRGVFPGSWEPQWMWCSLSHCCVKCCNDTRALCWGGVPSEGGGVGLLCQPWASQSTGDAQFS